MKIFRDNTTLLILLLFGGLLYITIYRGHRVDYLKPTGSLPKFPSSKSIKFEPEYLIDTDKGEITVALDVQILDSLTSIDSLWITLYDSSQKPLQPAERISTGLDVKVRHRHFRIHQSYTYADAGPEELMAKFYIKESHKSPVDLFVEIERGKKFELRRKNRYDFIILLYPVLWIAFGVLFLAKVTNLIRNKEQHDDDV